MTLFLKQWALLFYSYSRIDAIKCSTLAIIKLYKLYLEEKVVTKLDVLSLENLMVVDVRAKNVNGAIEAWRDGEGILRAESCARQVFYGFEKDLSGFPWDESDEVNHRQGSAAYEFLLKLISGCESPRFGETHIKNQFFERWKKATQKPFFPENKYAEFIGQLRRDVNHVQEKIMSKFGKLAPEQIARDLSKQKRGEKIVVLGDLSLRGRLSRCTERVLRICENKQKRLDGFLTVTHPDKEVLATISDELREMKVSGKVRSNILISDFEDAAQSILTADQVYACIPMGSREGDEEKIVQTWKSGVADVCGQLTHLTGIQGPEVKSTNLWKAADLQNYISPEDIEVEKQRRYASNDRVSLQIKQAFALIAKIRGEGRQVLESELKESAPELYSPV